MSAKKKQVIVDKYLELIKETEYDKISVTDLVAACTISRQTFYYHFDDIDSMVTWAFNEAMQKTLNSVVEKKNYFEALESFFTMLERFHYVIKNSMSTSHAMFIYNLLYNTIYNYFISYYEQSPKHSAMTSREQKFGVSYTATALTGLILLEIQKNDCSYQHIIDEIYNTFYKKNNQ